MSSMTTNTFVPPIWGYDLGTPEARQARAAGWGRADLLWEHLMEGACAAWGQGDRIRAARLARRADWIARLCFDRQDIRRVPGLVNRALLGQGRSRRLARAARLWDHGAAAAIVGMQIAPRARSSLFHLRMEARHRDTYHGNMRTRFGKFASETAQTIAALQQDQPAPHCHFARWRGEKPTVYDDTRKVMAACLLIFDG